MSGKNTIHVVLKVVRKSNRTKYDTYSRQNVPMFDSVTELRKFLLANFALELLPAKTTSSFKGAYYMEPSYPAKRVKNCI